MTRKSSTDNDSLDLLLDTICNTFGGVLFVSMLVVILLNLTSEAETTAPPDDATQARMVRAQNRLRESEAELERLQQTLEQMESLETQFSNPDLRKTLDELRRQESRRNNLLKSKSSRLQQVANDQNAVNDVAKKIKDHQDEINKAQDALDRIERELQREVAKRSESAELPTMRYTTKRAHPLFLVNSRLCTNFMQRKDSKGTFLEPDLGKGTTLDPARSVTQYLSTLDRQRDYIVIVVYEDSFKEFPIVKDAVVRAKFEYLLLPLPLGEKVYVGAARGRVPVQ